MYRRPPERNGRAGFGFVWEFFFAGFFVVFCGVVLCLLFCFLVGRLSVSDTLCVNDVMTLCLLLFFCFFMRVRGWMVERRMKRGK